MGYSSWSVKLITHILQASYYSLLLDSACKQRTDTNRTVCFVTAGVTVLSPELNLAHRMMSALPPFVPSSSQRVTNEQCIKDSQLYLQELRKFALWALKSEYLFMGSSFTQ